MDEISVKPARVRAAVGGTLAPTLRTSALALAGALAPAIACAVDVPFPPDPNPCVIVSTFGGGQFADPRADDLWKTFSHATQDALVARLEDDGYGVERLFTDHVRGHDDRHVALDAVERTRCPKVIQLLLIVESGGPAPRFGLDVSVLAYVRNDERQVGPVKQWAHSYRYPRTPEGFTQFDANEFARAVARDLANAHVVDYAGSGSASPAASGAARASAAASR